MSMSSEVIMTPSAALRSENIASPLLAKGPLQKSKKGTAGAPSYVTSLQDSGLFSLLGQQVSKKVSAVCTFASDDVPSSFLDHTVMEKKQAAAAETKRLGRSV